jgi:hypothetical protein
MTSKVLSLIVLSIATWLPQVSGQTPPQADEAFAFRILGAGVSAEDVFYSSGGKAIPVRIETEFRSPYYVYKGPRTKLAFFRQVPGSDGKLIHQPVGAVNLTGAGNRPLLIFVQQPGLAGSYVIHPFADSSKDVPPGGFRFVNFTTRKIAMMFDQQKIIIPSGEQVIVQGERGKTSSLNAVKMFGVLLNDEIKPIYSDLWPYNPKMRGLVLISPTMLNSTGAEVKCLNEHIILIPEDPEPKGIPGSVTGGAAQ